MSFSNKNESVSDTRLDELLLSLRAEETTPEQPPVINTFRLQMEAERRRSRIQLQIVTIAAFISVTATLALLAYFAFVLLPEMEKHFSPGTRFLLAQIKQSFASCQGWFLALGAAMLLGYLFSAVLMIAKRDVLFTKKE